MSDDYGLRRIKKIAEDQTMNASDKAIECLVALDMLPQKDIARPDFRAAAETFGMLAIAEALTTGTGYGLADVFVRGMVRQ